jgi:hypothetical protein
MPRGLPAIHLRICPAASHFMPARESHAIHLRIYPAAEPFHALRVAWATCASDLIETEDAHMESVSKPPSSAI